MLVERLRSRPEGPTIVYVTLQRTAERMAEVLRSAGFDAQPYHAGLDPDRRGRVQDAFLASGRMIVVATIAFGMGIDKANIRYVYHYNPPKSLEHLAQEIGRAGRDGEPSTCELQLCHDDLPLLQNFVYGDTPTRAAIQSLVGALLNDSNADNKHEHDNGKANDDTIALALTSFGNAHDVRPLVVRTLLTYLELDGYLEAMTPVYDRFRYRLIASEEDILARLPQDEPQQLMKGLLAASKKARIWFTVEAEKVAAKLSVPRDRVVRALDWLAGEGLVELKAEGLLHRYRRLRTADIDALTDDLYERMLTREQAEVDRLAAVIDLAAMKDCQVRALSRHFSDSAPADPCGHCEHCLTGPIALEKMAEVEIDAPTWELALQLKAEQPALADSRILARFLCGIRSPLLTRQKLTKHELFGCFSAVPFGQVMQRAATDAPI